MPHGEMIRRARELAEHEYDIPFSDRRQVSVETLLHWAARYRNGGLGSFRAAAAFGSWKAARDLAAVGATDRTFETRKSASQRHDVAARAGAGIGGWDSAIVRKFVVSILEEEWPDEASAAGQDGIQKV
jgi:urease accessory protein UreF